MLGMNTYEAMGVPVPREFSEDRIIVPPPCVPQALPVAQPAPREQGDEVDEL